MYRLSINLNSFSKHCLNGLLSYKRLPATAEVKTNTNTKTINFNSDLPPKGVASIGATIVPSRAGLRKLIVDIDAKEQKDFKGEGEIFINP